MVPESEKIIPSSAVGRGGKYFKFLRLPPLAIMMPSRRKFRSGGELAIPGRRRKAGGAVFPGNDSSEAASEVGLGHRAARVLVSTEEERMEDHRGSKRKEGRRRDGRSRGRKKVQQ